MDEAIMKQPIINKISLSRFNSFVSYARNPRVKYHSRELEWYETDDQKILGALLIDTIDNDYVGLVFAQDLNKKYRFINGVFSEPDQTKTRKSLIKLIHEMYPDAEKRGVQGDEKSKSMDFFAPIRKDNKDPNFILISTSKEYSAAKNIIEPLMRWYEDIDGNFVEQFQTTGFNQRLWEICLFSIFTENDCVFDTSHHAPDFHLNYINGFYQFAFSIEATTVNRPVDRSGQPIAMPEVVEDDPVHYDNLITNYFPTRYSGPLLAKLNKKYWNEKHVDGKPLILAITDCQFDGAGKITGDALPIYLYGIKQSVSTSGKIKSKKIEKHIWGTKEVPSGFFNFEGAENISAVIFTASCNVDKFNRMGLKDGFNSSKYKIRRIYQKLNTDSDTVETIQKIIPSKKYSERWDEGLIVYHNPNAIHPFPIVALSNAAHFTMNDGIIHCDFIEPPITDDYSVIVGS